MTSALRPYIDWLATTREGAFPPRLLNLRKNYPVQHPDEFRPYFKFRKRMAPLLGHAKRFICPVNAVVTLGAEQIAHPAGFVERNPHLPFPVVYLQVEISATKESTGETKPPMWVCYLLRETGPHTFEGLYAAWDSNTRDVYEKPYRLSYSPDGCEHQPLCPVDDDGPEDAITRLMMLLPLLAVDDINNPESRQEHHPGRKLVGKSGVRKGERVEYSRLIDLNRASSSDGHGTGEGTKHRDHAVRGHWRHLKHGRVIWVRTHRRGDVSLGSVDSEYLAPTETVTTSTESRSNAD